MRAKERIPMKPAVTPKRHAPPVPKAPRSKGQPLDAATRSFFEPRFGHDFSQVRVHADQDSARSAVALGAAAYTVGNDIAFAPGKYSPGAEGKGLLAHELAHVVQQDGAGNMPAGQAELERQANGAAGNIVAGMPAPIGEKSAPPGQPQFQKSDNAHPGAEPKPEEYIASHKGLLFLDREKLASDLMGLAWQSSVHYKFVLQVLQTLSASDRIEVAGFFCKQASDSFLRDTALKPEGRDFLSAVANLLPDKDHQRERVTHIVAAGPQEEREKERVEALETIKKGKSKTLDVNLYTKYEGEDRTEMLLESTAKSREQRKETDLAFSMENFEDIAATLAEIAKQTGAKDFVRALHLLGHGAENHFGFGKYFYSSENLKEYKTGLLAPFMAEHGTVHLEGCNVAAGEAGKKYMKEIGRIFFGDKKSGYIKGNACEALNLVGAGISECDPRTLRWPSDFK